MIESLVILLIIILVIINHKSRKESSHLRKALKADDEFRLLLINGLLPLKAFQMSFTYLNASSVLSSLSVEREHYNKNNNRWGSCYFDLLETLIIQNASVDMILESLDAIDYMKESQNQSKISTKLAMISILSGLLLLGYLLIVVSLFINILGG